MILYDIQCSAKVFLVSRCKVSLTWDSNPRPSDFRLRCSPNMS